MTPVQAAVSQIIIDLKLRGYVSHDSDPNWAKEGRAWDSILSRFFSPGSDLEQVIRERDEAVRLLRDSLAELKPFHWALSLKGRIRAFLNNMNDRDGRESAE